MCPGRGAGRGHGRGHGGGAGGGGGGGGGQGGEGCHQLRQGGVLAAAAARLIHSQVSARVDSARFERSMIISASYTMQICRFSINWMAK